MSSAQPESSFNFIPQGAIIQEFKVAGHNLVQAFPNAELYQTHSHFYFGETIGRTCNRISNARIDNLNGTSYALTANDGSNSLHGGRHGWGRKMFAGPMPISRNGKEGVMFVYVSPHLEEGYPGTVELKVWYTAWKEDDGNGAEKTVLEIEYEAELIGNECEETVVGVTNHSYFNLSDSPTIDGTEVRLFTDQYLPTNSSGLPLGHIANHPIIKASTPLILNEDVPPIDSCMVINTDPHTVPIDTRPLPLSPIATLFHPSTNLHLEISSTEPAFQFYTGEYVDIPAVGEDSPARPPRAGLCIEPSRYVNACNVDGWRNMVVLQKGATWGAKSVYTAWKA